MQARQLATPKSDFHIYVLVLQAQLMLAAQNFLGLVETRNQLYRARPATMIYFEPIFTDPQKPSLRAKATVMMLSRRRAPAILQHIFYVGGRCYNDPRHAENMMQPLVSVLSNRFGNCILTDEMKDALPGLVN